MPLQSSPTDGGGKAQTQRRAFKTGGLFRGRLSKPAESPSRLGHVVARCAHEIDDRIVLHLQLVAADGALVEGFQVLGALEHRAQIAALLVEAIAKTGRRLSALWDEITQKYGAAEMAEHDFHFSSAERTRIFKLLMEDKQLPEFPCEIAKVSFKEGSIVKAGQLLFQIDPAQYQATVALRKAELEKAEATLAEAEKYHKRVMAANDQAVSAADRDTAESSVLQGKAAVSQAKANLRLAEINLGYCRITAPITGKIGIANLTKGNYVTPSSGALATIVQMDPVRVSYTLPDRDYLDQLELFKKEGSVYKTKLILSNGSELDVPGQRDFEDNTVDQMTGTVMMRLRYTNDSGMLIPGEMVRVFTQPVKSRIVNVIPQTAVMADAEGDYVYVVEAARRQGQAGTRNGHAA